MGRVKESELEDIRIEYELWLAQQAYEECQSRLRLSCACRANVRPLAYPLQARIVELSTDIVNGRSREVEQKTR